MHISENVKTHSSKDRQSFMQYITHLRRTMWISANVGLISAASY